MVVSKLSSLKNGTPGLFSSLSRFDKPLALLLLRATDTLRNTSASAWRAAIVSLERLHHFVASLSHFSVQAMERRLRAWREFARTRKFVRRDASGYIKDVVEYKKELKQNGNGH